MDFTPHAKPVVALDILRAIDLAIAQDSGARFRVLLRKWMPEAEDAYREKDDPFRTHLGASEIGERCDRLLWYSWHWTCREEKPPRLYRLLNRGHLEEARFCALLEMIGMPVEAKDTNGKQHKLALLDGNFGGSCDGLAWAAMRRIVCEFKTHNRDSFEKLAGGLSSWRNFVEGKQGFTFTGDGVRASKPKHHAQAQVYIQGFKAEACLYLACCKDTDDLYAEWILPDEVAFNRSLAKASLITTVTSPPPKIGGTHAGPGWYECRFCKARGICHNGQTPERNCRTCKNGEVWKNGMWRCKLQEGKGGVDLFIMNSEAQLIGCPQHAFLEGLI